MSYFLWPHPTYSIRACIGPGAHVAKDVEQRFMDLYPGSYAALFSSARAGLYAIVEALGLGRNDFLWTPPYSSHCVLDAVARLATPMPVWDSARLTSALVYHQWGFVHRSPAGVEVIEDSADTLCAPGPVEFPNHGRFQVFSLPKILNCASGGLVLCRRPEDAQALIQIRERRGGSGRLQLALRFAGHSSRMAFAYWQGQEAANGGVPRAACSDILRALDHLPEVIADRKAKLSLAASLIPNWLTLNPSRFPTAIPVDSPELSAQTLSDLGLAAGFRHFNTTQKVDQQSLKKVLPLPIHQGVPMQSLARMIDTLKGVR
jgi:putative PLP-dependent aminotransferase (TIGR04422 family)